MRERARALLEAGAGEQLIELVRTLRVSPLPEDLVFLLRECSERVWGIDWFLVDTDREYGPLRARLVSGWLLRSVAHEGADPITAWLARHAAPELDSPPHLLQKGTATLLRQHLALNSERLRIDLASEDRVDWQRATPEHRAALLSLTAEWIAALVSE